MSGFVVTVDPFRLETLFSTERGLSYFPSGGDGELSGVDLQRIEVLLERLPPIEADCVRLSYLHRKTQMDIANIFGVTQPAIRYRIQRGLERLRFLAAFPELDPVQMCLDFKQVGLDDDECDILLAIYETTCQSAAAKRLDLTQGMVRHRFLKALVVLSDQESEPYPTYASAFRQIQQNFNILHEIKPQHPHA